MMTNQLFDEMLRISVILVNKSSAIVEGPRDALVRRNLANNETSHLKNIAMVN